MRSRIEKSWFCFVVSAFSFLLICACSGPEPTGVDYETIDTSGDPVQNSHVPADPITIEFKDGSFSLKAVAGYRISAKVVGKATYSYGWTAKIAPVDLALAWGYLAEQAGGEHVFFTQSDRWYFFQYDHDSHFTGRYISSHSSNNHIIPATKNMARAVRSIQKGQKIVMEGYLVNLTGVYEKQPVWWNSSLSRDDTGDHSYELFYVVTLRTGKYIYQ